MLPQIFWPGTACAADAGEKLCFQSTLEAAVLDVLWNGVAK